jgi:threonine 3-dehydrogenase
MQAVVKAGPRPGLELAELPRPRIGPDQVLVETILSSICGTDIHLFAWDQYCEPERFTFPRVIGHETVGTVVEVGAQVRGFEAGDVVSAESHLYCGSCGPCKMGRPDLCATDRILGEDADGAFAQYFALDARHLWRQRADLDPRLACVAEPFGNAVNVVATADVPTQSVVIFGGGPIGLFAAVLSRHFGADRTIVVEPSEYRRDLAKTVGADATIDPRNPDLRRAISEATRGDGADVGLEMSGSPAAFQQCLEAVRPGGRVVAFGLSGSKIEVDVTRHIVLRGVTVLGVTGRRLWETWRQSSNLLDRVGDQLRPVLTHEFPFREFGAAFDQLRQQDCGKILLRFRS